MIIWRNGAFLDAHGAISATDRAFLVGEGVFETTLVEDGAPAFLEAHIERMMKGAALFGMEFSSTPEAIRSAIALTARRNNLNGRAVCRLTLSRPGGGRGLLAGPDARLQLTIVTQDAPVPRRQLKLSVSNRRRLAVASTNIAKCVGAYAENILARRDAELQGAHEAVMLNEYGRVSCASAANLLLVTETGICTPPLGEGALPGVTRTIVLNAARAAGAAVEERPVELHEIDSAEILLSNSVLGVVHGCLSAAEMKVSRLGERLIADYDAQLKAEFNRQRSQGG